MNRIDHELSTLRLENQRLRNILKIAHGVEPTSEQPVLLPPDPGVVTDNSPVEAKLALYLRLFAARQDVYAHYWENSPHLAVMTGRTGEESVL